MPSVTGTQLMTDAFQALNVYMPGDTISANDSTTALRHLNLLVSEWKQQFLTIPAESRNVFPLVSGKGNSTNPYTIGLSGDLNIAKPPNQGSLTGAGLLLNASTPPVEIPRGIMTNDGYDHSSPAWSPDGNSLAVRRELGLSAVIAAKQNHGAPTDIVTFAAGGGGSQTPPYPV